MKKKLLTVIPIFCIAVFAALFFRQTLLFGKLPIPSDTLIGMYHPWLDMIANDFPSGIPYKNFLITDPVRQQIPWRKLSIEAWRKGKVNAWNPYSFSGTPLSTNIQSGFYNPFNIAFFVLPFPIAWTALIILQQILAGVFFYVFLRMSVRVSVYASLFGALSFMLCGFMTVWLTWGTISQTLLWLPLLLILFDTLLVTDDTKKKFGLGVGLGLVFSLQYVAGHSQIFLYSFLVLILYMWFRFLRMRGKYAGVKNALPYIGLGILIFTLITSIHWIPFLSELQLSSRLQSGSLYKSEGFFIPFQNIVQFVAPDFFGNPATLNYWGLWNYAEFSGYIGIVGLFFVLYALIAKKTNMSLFWIGVTALAFLFALPFSISQIPYLYKIPFLSSLQPTRLLSIIDFGLCTLSAIGFDLWLRNRRKIPIIISFIVMAGIVGFLWYVVKVNPYKISVENLDVTRRNIIFPTGIFGILLFIVSVVREIGEYIIPKKNIIIIISSVLLIGLSFFDLSRFGWKFTPFIDQKLFFSTPTTITYLQNQQRPFRVSALDDQILPPNVSAYYHIESIAGYDPLYNSRYETFIAAMERGEPNISPPYGFNRIIAPKNITSPLFRLLGVQFVLSLTDISNEKFVKVFQEGQTRVYAYSDVLPRAYLVEHLEYETDPQRIFQKLYSPDFIIGKTAIVEAHVPIIENGLAEWENVVITSYDENSMSLTTKTTMTRDKFVVIGTIYNKGWTARIDGKKVPLYRANYIFMGVVVPPGNHTVRLTYE